MARARTQAEELKQQAIHDIAKLRSLDMPGEEFDDALTRLETFCAVAIRIIAMTNPSKVRSAALTEEIAARSNGRTVVHD